MRASHFAFGAAAWEMALIAVTQSWWGAVLRGVVAFVLFAVGVAAREVEDEQ